MSSPDRPPSRQSPYLLFTLVAVVVALALFVVVAFTTRLHPFLVWLIAMSVATFALYGFDKLQSKSDGLRVPENVLHVVALLGGFAGGWAGMYLFRHKTQHLVFRIVLIIATVADLAAYWFLFR